MGSGPGNELFFVSICNVLLYPLIPVKNSPLRQKDNTPLELTSKITPCKKKIIKFKYGLNRLKKNKGHETLSNRKSTQLIKPGRHSRYREKNAHIAVSRDWAGTSRGLIQDRSAPKPMNAS